MKAWPHLLVGLLVLGAGTNIALLVVANSDESFATPPNYYDRAVHWDDIQAQESKNVELGWRVDVTTVGEGREVQLKIVDRQGRPVTQAQVEVDVCAVRRAGELVKAAAAENESGVYLSHVSLKARGLWDVHIRVRRGADIFDVVVRHEVG